MKLDLNSFAFSSRFSEANFRMMEDLLAEVIDNYPNEKTFSCYPYAIPTWRQKFQSAMIAFCHPDCTFYSSKVLKSKLQAFRPIIRVVVLENQAVKIAFRGYPKAPKPGVEIDNTPKPPELSSTEVDATDRALVIAYSVLKSRQRCDAPIVLINLSPELHNELVETFEDSILLQPQAEGKYLLI